MGEVPQPGPAVLAPGLERSLLQAIFRASSEGLLAVDAAGRVVAWSEALLELGGLSLALLEEGDAASVHARLLAQARAPEASAARLAWLLGHPAERAEDLLHLRDGRVLERRCAPWPSPGGLGQLWTFVEVSAREQLGEVIRECEQRFRLVYERAPAMLHSIDAAGRLITVSDAWLDRLGYTREEVLGRRSVEFLTPASQAYAREVVLPAFFRTGSCRDIAYQYLAKTGEVVDMLLSATCERDPDGRVLRSVAVLQDVTLRKRAESERDRLLVRERAARQEAQEAERRTSFLAEAGAVLSQSLDYRSTLSCLTELCVRDLADWCIVDLEEEGQLRREAWAHADPGKRPVFQELERRYPPHQSGLLKFVLESRKPLLIPAVTEEDFRRYFPDPAHRELIQSLGVESTMLVPLMTEGRTLGCLSLASRRPGRHYTTQDLEVAQELARRAAMAIDHARLYRQAQEAIGVRDMFLSLASHELKTPLTPISLLIQILRKRAEQGQPIDAALVERLQRPLERLTGLINDLLDVSRIQAGKLLVLPAPTGLRSLTRELVESLRVSAPTHPVELVEPADELVVMGDRARLAQVISNLLENAVKYSAPNAPIRVSLKAQEGQALLSVQDSGIGIPPEQRQQVFERFFRARNAPESRYGGLGLGLYIARDVVEHHGGRIWVESAVGQGSTFHVSLPLAT